MGERWIVKTVLQECCTPIYLPRLRQGTEGENKYIWIAYISQRLLNAWICFPQLFIGFGFPYEGPAPLEAIANGCVFLQARFNPPHSSLNHEFFRGKPTSREVSLLYDVTTKFVLSVCFFITQCIMISELMSLNCLVDLDMWRRKG